MLFRVFINYHEVDNLKISFNNHVIIMSEDDEYQNIKIIVILSVCLILL
jgi:hypothetical protein